MDEVIRIAAVLAAMSSPAVGDEAPGMSESLSMREPSAPLATAYLHAPVAPFATAYVHTPSAPLATSHVHAPTSQPVESVMSAGARAQATTDSWLGEDKFRHAAVTWAAAVFTYAGARAFEDDADMAMTIALPVAGVLGIGKEIADHRRGGPFSVRDLAADGIGAAAAWLFLREVR